MKKLKSYLDKQRGITLIALIIKIIVLLILAAVSIATLTGNNGIISKANEARRETDNQSFFEQIQVDVLGSVDKTGEPNYDKLKNALINNGIQVIEGTSFPIEVVYKGKTYEININGKVTEEKSVLSADDLETTEKANKYYGWNVVNYANTLPSDYQSIQWQLFYAGKINENDSIETNHIYLISKDYIPYNLLPAKNGAVPIPKGNTNYMTGFSNEWTNDFSMEVTDGVVPKYPNASVIGTIGRKLNNKLYLSSSLGSQSNTMVNIRAVAYMLDSDIWNNFKGTYADYAVGGPSIELLLKAYNKYKNYTGNLEYSAEVFGNGYIIKRNGQTIQNYVNIIEADSETKDNPYIVSDSQKSYGYWVSSPTSNGFYGIMNMGYRGYVDDKSFCNNSCGFRPLICLDSNIQLEKVKDENNKDVFRIVE